MPIEGNISKSVPAHKQIRLARRAQELSQLEVALHVGISQSQYSLFEHGHVHLAPGVLDEIYNMLGMKQKSTGRNYLEG